MKPVLYFVIILIALSAAGCSQPRPSKQANDTTETNFREAFVPAKPTQPATIKNNATLIEATIESIELIDDVNYKLSVTIISAAPVDGFDSFADAGQSVNLIPDYFHAESGKIEMSNDHNQRLLSLRNIKQGEIFKGKISMNAKGKWFLIEVIKN